MPGKAFNRWGVALALLLAFPQMAQAYVDPGTGTMLWQVAAGTVIGGLFYLNRISGWLRQRVGLRSDRVLGFAFATVFAVVISPVTMTLFAEHPLPRFNDIFLVGIVLTAYLFTWESALYLTIVSLLVSAWILPPGGSFSVQQFADWYRLLSFAALSVFLICLISRMKARRTAGDEVHRSFGMTRAAAGAD